MKKDDNFIMLPTVDFCFAGLMENPKVRKGFVAAIMKVPPEKIKETELLPTILKRESKDDKLGILDVRVVMEDGTQIDIEMQVVYFAYWDKRALFYLSKMYAGQIKKGESYKEMKKCIHVSILDFVYFPDDKECYRTIHFCDDRTGKIYTDMMEIQILELQKLPKEMETIGNDIFAWMKFFSGRSKKEFEEMSKGNEYLEEAYNTLISLSADDIRLREYEAREKALKDYNTQMGSAFERGMQQGIEKGMRKGIQRGVFEKLVMLVCKKLDKGYDVPAIADMLEEEESVIQKICDVASKYAPDYDIENIVAELVRE